MDIGQLVEALLAILPFFSLLYVTRKDSKSSVTQSVEEVKTLENRVNILELSTKHNDERDKEILKQVASTNVTVNNIDKGITSFQLEYAKGMEKINGRLIVVVEKQESLEARVDKLDEKLQAIENNGNCTNGNK